MPAGVVRLSFDRSLSPAEELPGGAIKVGAWRSMLAQRRRNALMAVALTGLVFLTIGVALGVGGIWLAWLGGSWYYVIAAFSFLLTAALLYRRKAAALWVYAALVVGTLGWAIWEIGFDWWQLAPRG